MPSTWLVVTPYARQCGPPEFSATLPPMVHAFWLEGSGAKYKPYLLAAVERSMLTTPGSTTASRLTSSISTMLVMRVSAMTMPPCSAIAPPLRPVPAPRATTGTPWAPAAFTTSETSDVVRGRTTTVGSARSTEPSYSKTIRSSGLCTTFGSPTTAVRSRMSSELLMG